jgi:hypothetical protein
MPDILIQGGDAGAAALAMRAAVNEIFGTDPLQSHRGEARPGTRGALEFATLILTIPPAVIYSKKITEEFGFAELWRRLMARGEKEQKATGARITIDPGDGHHIPIEQAHPDKIREALAALGERIKRQQPSRP